MNRLDDLRVCSRALSNVDDLQTIDTDVDWDLKAPSPNCARPPLSYKSRVDQRRATRRECGFVRSPLSGFYRAQIQRTSSRRRRALLRAPGGLR
jgi:hypothetical protein